MLDIGLRLPDAAGRRGARARLQGRPHRRGGRRGPGRLRLVQDPEDPRHRSAAGSATTVPAAIRSLVLGLDGRRPAHLPAALPDPGRPHRPAGPLRADRPGRARSSTPATCGSSSATTPPTPTWTSPTTGSRSWHPLNQSLYVGYKVMLAGLLIIAKGDRIAMNSSVETRYPFLDDDVIAFCAAIAPEYKLHGMTEKWILRQVAARTLPPQIANRPKTMFRASRSEAFLGPEPPGLGRPAPQPRVAPRRPATSTPTACSRERAAAGRAARGSRPSGSIIDLSLTCVVATQLWHHIFLRRRPLRPARLDAVYASRAVCRQPGHARSARSGLHGPELTPRSSERHRKAASQLCYRASEFLRVSSVFIKVVVTARPSAIDPL